MKRVQEKEREPPKEKVPAQDLGQGLETRASAAFSLEKVKTNQN